MELAAVILVIAVLLALCIPKPSPELRGETPAEQAADVGKSCGTVVLGIIAFVVVMALVTWAANGSLDNIVEDTRNQQMQRAGR